MSAPSAVDALAERLAASGADFEWMDEPVEAAACVRIRCIGPFQGRRVVWEARLMTLEHWRGLHPPGPGEPAQRQCIAIAPGTGEVRQVDIALAVPVVDVPVIRKALVMLRQYKRLAVGRHVFGPAG